MVGWTDVDGWNDCGQGAQADGRMEGLALIQVAYTFYYWADLFMLVCLFVTCGSSFCHWILVCTALVVVTHALPAVAALVASSLPLVTWKTDADSQGCFSRSRS